MHASAMASTSYTLYHFVYTTIFRNRHYCLLLTHEEMMLREFMFFAQVHTVASGKASLHPYLSKSRA